MIQVLQSVPFFLTTGALLAGFFSILTACAGEYVQAAQWILVAMLLDGLDGFFARLLRVTSRFGAELDTFVDFSSFGVAPAVLVHRAVLKDFGTWGLVMAGAVVLSGAVRLARFRIVDPYRGQRGYLGLPITVNAAWLALFVFATELGVVNEDWFSLREGPLAAFVWASAMIFTVLQVSRVRYHKPTKDPLFMVVSAAVVVAIFTHGPLAVATALTMCGYAFYMAFLSPFFHRQELSHAAEEAGKDPLFFG